MRQVVLPLLLFVFGLLTAPVYADGYSQATPKPTPAPRPPAGTPAATVASAPIRVTPPLPTPTRAKLPPSPTPAPPTATAAPAPPPPDPTDPPIVTSVPTPAPAAVQPKPAAPPRSTPTLVPSFEPTLAVVDVANDPNAHSNITPVPPTPTPSATPAATASPTVSSLADQDLVNGIFAESLDPLLVGGRLGLIGGIGVALGFVAIQQLRARTRR